MWKRKDGAARAQQRPRGRRGELPGCRAQQQISSKPSARPAGHRRSWIYGAAPHEQQMLESAHICIFTAGELDANQG